MSDISEDPVAPPPDPDLAGTLRFLKILVAALAATMILGLIAIVALLVIRLPATTAVGPAPLPALPPAVRLPAGATASAVTFGKGWVAVVTGAGAILIYDSATGALRQTVTPAP